MPGDVRLFRRAVLADEVASQRLGIGDRFLNRPATGGVTGLDERIALAGENVNERVELVFVRSRTVAVAVAIYDQTTIPFFGDVDAELGAVDLAELGARSGVDRREKREYQQQGFHGEFQYTTRTAVGRSGLIFALALRFLCPSPATSPAAPPGARAAFRRQASARSPLRKTHRWLCALPY